MATDPQEWTCDANEALSISLVRNLDDAMAVVEEDPEGRVLLPFNPKFTYPIFGEQEKIYGYKDLRIELNMASGSLKQYLNINYSAKLDSQADDIEGTLYKFIPSDYTKSPEPFAETVNRDAQNFVPPGKKIASYISTEYEDDEEPTVEYEVYHCTWATPGFKDFHRHAQLFIMLYIEAGSYIQEDEDQWEFLLLFEKRPKKSISDTLANPNPNPNPSQNGASSSKPSNGDNNDQADEEEEEHPGNFSYHFMGYVSAYPFWCYPDQVRLRLSQFVILPPYQGEGHGSQLYNALYDYALTLPIVSELTVEDPSEAFEDLRDRNDLTRLREELRESEELGRGAPVGKGWFEGERRRGKYAKRQFSRLIEMLLLEKLKAKAGGERYKAYRLYVKERLYRFNYSLLAQIEPDERRTKLQETYQNVEDDYKRILESVRKEEEGELWEWTLTPGEEEGEGEEDEGEE